MIEPQYGDVISVNHGIYNHFGIFVDKNHVIHYTGKDEDFLLRKMIINSKSVERIRASGLDRNLTDDAKALYLLYQIKNKVKFKIYSPEETVKRARSKIGERKFFLPGNNCEHFAIWCKTGVRQSYQVNLVLKAVFVKMDMGMDLWKYVDKSIHVFLLYDKI